MRFGHPHPALRADLPPGGEVKGRFGRPHPALRADLPPGGEVKSSRDRLEMGKLQDRNERVVEVGAA